MLKFKDFLPKCLVPAKLLQAPSYETLEEAAAAAGDWLKTNPVKLVQLETVMLPNISHKKGSIDARFVVSDSIPSAWYQFIRVWYEE